MAKVEAAPSPIIVDKAAGESSGMSTLTYEKYAEQELWEGRPGGPWSLINVHVRTGLGDKADLEGSFNITLKPGQGYELGVFEQGHGPATTDPIRLADVTVFCLWKKPEARGLITDQNRAFGGTWYWHQTHTSVPTSIVSIGVSRTAPTVDPNGLPLLKNPDGAPTVPLTVGATDHKVELKPLIPGQHYYFVVIVTDQFGNWDVRQEQFTTLRRKLTVEFTTLHVYNDGDPFDDGEGEFWFKVYRGEPWQSVTLMEFHRDTADIDDWFETDRPYSLGYVYTDGPSVVIPGEGAVYVNSRGIEHDGIFEDDEGAWSNDRRLFFPSGRSAEVVTNQTFLMDCPTSTDGDDFHYGVDVSYSVAYVP